MVCVRGHQGGVEQLRYRLNLIDIDLQFAWAGAGGPRVGPTVLRLNNVASWVNTSTVPTLFKPTP
jgi:hypothetical protein